MDHVASLSPDQQPGTRSQQPFETYLHDIPASVVVLKLSARAVLAQKFWRGHCSISPFITESIRSPKPKKYELHIGLHFSSQLLNLGEGNR